jgi:hypothetical protein
VERSYKQGDTLVKQGQELQKLIFIKQGEVMLTSKDYVIPPWKRKVCVCVCVCVWGGVWVVIREKEREIERGGVKCM